jgi:F subunit of K+-transporting ATPase
VEFHYLYAGSDDDRVYSGFLRGRAALCSRLREVEVGNDMSHTTFVVLILTVATLVYLVITLLYPEKF